MQMVKRPESETRFQELPYPPKMITLGRQLFAGQLWQQLYTEQAAVLDGKQRPANIFKQPLHAILYYSATDHLFSPRPLFNPGTLERLDANGVTTPERLFSLNASFTPDQMNSLRQYMFNLAVGPEVLLISRADGQKPVPISPQAERELQKSLTHFFLHVGEKRGTFFVAIIRNGLEDGRIHLSEEIGRRFGTMTIQSVQDMERFALNRIANMKEFDQFLPFDINSFPRQIWNATCTHDLVRMFPQINFPTLTLKKLNLLSQTYTEIEPLFKGQAAYYRLNKIGILRLFNLIDGKKLSAAANDDIQDCLKAFFGKPNPL